MNGYDTSTFLDDTGLSATDINENLVNTGDFSILPEKDSILEEGDDDKERSKSILDDGSEIEAWEKALKERKSSNVNKKMAPEDISISDDDDF